MGRFYVSIKPYANDDGTAHEADFRDISDDVLFTGFGKTKQHLDANQFEAGIFRHSSFNMVLDNRSGLYSDVGEPYTIFKHKRNNSIVRIEWDFYAEPKPLGLHPPLTFKCTERVVLGDFLLNDDSNKARAITNESTFKCLGMSSLFNNMASNFDTLADGDTYSEVIFKMLNQTYATDILTVLQANIVCDTDDEIDDKTAGDLENKTATQVLKKLLPFANSILFIEGSTVFVSSRAETADLKHTFYGPGSLNGAENTFDITNYRSGAHRVKNFITLKNTSKLSQDPTSIAKHGEKRFKPEIEFAPSTDGTKQQAALDAIRDEYRNAKIELTVLAPQDFETLALRRSDKVNFDFPVRFLFANGVLLPYYGVAIYDDVDRYPAEIADIEIPAGTEFKIIDIIKSGVEETIAFNCRQVGV